MRKDGRYLRNADPLYTVACHVMDKRNDATNMVEVDVPLAPMHDYICKKRAEGKQISHLALLIAAYLRGVAEYPEINRFVVNKRIYARNEFAVGMVVMKPDKENGTMNKMFFELEDDIFTVQEKLDSYIEKNRSVGDNNKTDKAVKILLSIPGLMRFGVCLCKFLDKFGLLPKFVIDASPFHTSVVVSNLASIRSKHIYHHIYNFGTTGVIVTMGSPIEVPTKTAQGIEFVRSIPLGIVTDERIASGSYYTAFMHKLLENLAFPEVLEGPPPFEPVREYLTERQKKKLQKAKENKK